LHELLFYNIIREGSALGISNFSLMFIWKGITNACTLRVAWDCEMDGVCYKIDVKDTDRNQHMFFWLYRHQCITFFSDKIHIHIGPDWPVTIAGAVSHLCIGMPW
ncbi:hypothetical protein ACJX0J_018859, partial [Zea mays]